MNKPRRPNDLETARPMLDESDIGSGGQTPAQQETEEMIRQIPPLPASGTSPAGGDTKPRAPK